MFMNQLVANWQKAREQVLGKEEFVSEEMQTTFFQTIEVYYFFFMLSLPILLVQMILLTPAVYLVLNSTHYLGKSYLERALWITIVVMLSFFMPGVYYVYYLIRYALGRRPVRGSDDLIPEPKFSGKPFVEQLEKV